MRFCSIHYDTAGTKWCSEFEPGCTAAVRSWREPAAWHFAEVRQVQFVFNGIYLEPS